MQNTSVQSRSPEPPAMSRPAIELAVINGNGLSRRVTSRRARIQGRQRSRRAVEQPALFDVNDVIPLQNRLRVIALHVPWYGFRTQARLARDSGISRAAVSRLIRHQVQPSLSVALRVTRALSIRLGRPLDVWEVFSLDGTYPTASVCKLCGCRSCSLGAAAIAQAEKGHREGGA